MGILACVEFCVEFVMDCASLFGYIDGVKTTMNPTQSPAVATHTPAYELRDLEDGGALIVKIDCNSEARAIALTCEAGHEFAKIVDELNLLHGLYEEARAALESAKE